MQTFGQADGTSMADSLQPECTQVVILLHLRSSGDLLV